MYINIKHFEIPQPLCFLRKQHSDLSFFKQTNIKWR